MYIHVATNREIKASDVLSMFGVSPADLFQPEMDETEAGN